MSAEFQPLPVPLKTDQLVEYLRRELPRLAAILNSAVRSELSIRHSAPDKPVNGLYYADGTDWDPGSGRGIYRYDESATSYTFLA